MYEILFQNALITVRTFNIFLALGFIFTGAFLIRYVNKQKMNLNFLAKYFLHLLSAVIVMGRLFDAIENFAFYKTNPLAFLYIWDLNFSFFGALTGLVITLYFLAKKNREDFWGWLDASILSSLFLMIFIHIGQFFSGANYGLPTNLPWGISFDVTNIPFVSPIHPTQLYAALFTILLLTYSVKKSKRTHLSGISGSLALMFYSIAMLGNDFLHGDPSLYVKIAFGIIATLAFISYVHCTHKTHTIS